MKDNQSVNFLDEEFFVTEVAFEKLPQELLLDADPCWHRIQQYAVDSRCFAVLHGDDIVACCVVRNNNSEDAEVMNIAVAEGFKGKGVGSWLLKHVIELCRQSKLKRLVLGTGSFGYQLTFYQRLGFRVDSVIKNYFLDNYSEALYEHGIQHKDMLRLQLEL